MGQGPVRTTAFFLLSSGSHGMDVVVGWLAWVSSELHLQANKSVRET